MYKIILLAACVALLSCSTKNNNTTQAKNSESAVSTKEKTIKLTPLQTKYTVAVGQKMEYTASVHGSVGATTKVTTDESIVKLIDTDFKYNNPSKSDMPGGDSGKRTYTFEALQPGIGSLTIVDSFQGEVQNTYELEITVE